MGNWKQTISKNMNEIKTAVVDDNRRKEIVFAGINIALALVALVMSIINVFTAEYTLMGVTLTFTFLCVLNIVLLKAKVNQDVVHCVFGGEALALLGFFLVSGIPEGFSSLWICLIPSFSLLVFGRKNGSIYSLVALAMVIFFLWLPVGMNFLEYGYTETFMLRFPFLYCAIFAISYLVEYVRSKTHDRLEEAEHEYRYLYRHDALTGLLNRYGINEYIDKAFDNSKAQKLAIMIIDIDFFKKVNDNYGHNAGDKVLTDLGKIMQNTLCQHCECGRWGGEEFIALMQWDHDPLAAAESLRKKVEETVIHYEDMEISITISVGLCMVQNTSKVTIAQMVNQADNCLYEAKEKGRNQTCSCQLG